MLTEDILQDWDVPELEIQEIMTFKKWYMIYKLSDESVKREITKIFTTEV